MSDILGSVKRVLFTKSRRRGAERDTAVATQPTQNPYDQFDIFEPVPSNTDPVVLTPPTAPLPQIDDDEEDVVSGLRIGLWGHIRYSRIGIWIGGARIRVRSGLSIRQRIKRYNAIYKGGYGAPDTKVKKEC